MVDFSKDIRHKGKTKEEIIKDIQRLLLQNDYSVNSVFGTTKYMKDNLEPNIEWILNRDDIAIAKEDKIFILKKE